MSKRIIALIFILLSGAKSLAYQLDVSVDEEIKKKYNSSQLNYDVPNLPKVEKSAAQQAPTTQLKYETAVPVITKIDKTDAIILKSGTKFSANSNQTISDGLKVGGVISFKTVAPVYAKYITIPTGAKITATVANAHRPQFFGNGGLVVIRINSITYNGKTYSLDGKITKANYKKIFFNNIKGKRAYLKGVSNKVKKGENFYKKSKQVAGKMSNNSLLQIFSFVPTITGAVGCAVCTVLSPITGLTQKGESITIPAGSRFELKLTEDAYFSN